MIIFSEMESSGFFSDYSGDGRQSTSSLFQVSISIFDALKQHIMSKYKVSLEIIPES